MFDHLEDVDDDEIQEMFENRLEQRRQERDGVASQMAAAVPGDDKDDVIETMHESIPDEQTDINPHDLFILYTITEVAVSQGLVPHAEGHVTALDSLQRVLEENMDDFVEKAQAQVDGLKEQFGDEDGDMGGMFQ